MLKQDLALYEISTDLIKVAGDLYETLQAIFGYVILHFGVHAVDFILYDTPTRTLRFVAGRGFYTQNFDRAPARVTALAGQVVRDEHTALIRNLKNLIGQLNGTELAREGFVSYIGVPLVVNGQLEGVIELFCRAEWQMGNEELKLLERVVAQSGLAVHRAMEIRKLQFENQELAHTIDATITAMVSALEMREQESEGHTARVAEMTVQFARALNFQEAHLVNVRRGALLHDIGKMGVPESVLLKPEALTEDEWNQMRQHPTIGYTMLAPIEPLRLALAIPYCHHEKWDGTGYPRGLKGEEIPLEARLFAVVDVWDALRSARPYRQSWPEEKVIAHILDRGGRQFEQRLAEMFVKLVQAGNLQRKRESGEGELTRNYATQTIST
ncbi:MAG: HD domain-containing protein [Chloroflexi bacterium]|nr:HD domain-containing protein [Chloroflexota bacterium]